MVSQSAIDSARRAFEDACSHRTLLRNELAAQPTAGLEDAFKRACEGVTYYRARVDALIVQRIRERDRAAKDILESMGLSGVMP